MPTRQSLYFTAPRQVEVRTETRPAPPAGEVLIRTRVSAISPGTEMLVYRDETPKQLQRDESIAALAGDFEYPFQYGYAAVGEIIALGPNVEPAWLGQRVFAFNPHESHFTAPVSAVVPVPGALSNADAALLPNMETAVNLVMDGQPVIGERVAVIGQGIVGLLVTALLARFPLEALVTLDYYPNRREASAALGARAHHPEAMAASAPQSQPDYDLIFELSGAPAALNTAIRMAGFDSRIVVGSWYGDKQAALDLGGKFHRQRIQLISSQVSTLAPRFQGRWDKQRRFATVLKFLEEIHPARFITHRVSLDDAARAYHLLDENPQEAIQVIFEYDPPDGVQITV